MQGKKYTESKTLWTSAALLISSAVSIALHFTETNVLTPDMLSAAFTGAASGFVFLILRLVTKEPVGKQTEGNGANAGTTVLLLFIVALMSAGCTTIRAKKSIDLQIKNGPPCVVIVKVDGEKAVEVTGPKACKVKDAR